MIYNEELYFESLAQLENYDSGFSNYFKDELENYEFRFSNYFKDQSKKFKAVNTEGKKAGTAVGEKTLIVITLTLNLILEFK